MLTISLLTDFGINDNFSGVIKAVILKINPNLRLIDITHSINPQDILQAAFLLASSYRFFPRGTIHLVVVDPGVGSQRKKILIQSENYYFIAPDNGVLDLTLRRERVKKIIEITNERYFLKPLSNTFHARDIFSPVAAYLSKGVKPSLFGKPIKKIKSLDIPKPKSKTDILSGEVIYIDRFGNLISNIDTDTLARFIKNKKIKIRIKNKTINHLSASYSEANPFKPLAIVDSFNRLEIALNSGSAAHELKAKKGTRIEIIRR